MSVVSHLNLNAQTIEQRHSVSGKPVSIGNGFRALSFNHSNYDGDMDPLLMVDHFRMSKPTFGPHAHAGMSAVSILFEDSVGVFNNKDSLGNDINLMPGDLYWLKAARGAVHDEKPTPGSRTHALQVFVNLPARMKYDAPTSLHLPATSMPVLTEKGYRARIVLGNSGESQGEMSPALPMTIIDVTLEKDAKFSHEVKAGQGLFILSISGPVIAEFGHQFADLSAKASATFRPSAAKQCISLSALEPAHIVLIQAQPVAEPFVMHGPFAMSTPAENEAVMAAYAAGELGKIEP